MRVLRGGSGKQDMHFFGLFDPTDPRAPRFRTFASDWMAFSGSVEEQFRVTNWLTRKRRFARDAFRLLVVTEDMC